MSVEEAHEKLNYLSRYLELRIDNDLISDPWFVWFEKAYKYRSDKRYSIFEPHFSKSMHINDGILGLSPCLGLYGKDFHNVVCYKLGNFYKGKFIALTSWLPNLNFDPEKCQLYKPKG